jgi:hypothetical protein
MSTTDPILATSASPNTKPDAAVEYMVLAQTLERLLQRSEDESSEEGSVGFSNQLSRPMAECVARYITGFGL